MKSEATRRRETEEAAQWFRDRLDYDPETGALTWKDVSIVRPVRRGIVAGCRHFSNGKNNCGYVIVHVVVGGQSWHYKGHRIAWMLYYRQWPITMLDHRDGDGMNNAISNLRKVTSQENRRNSRRQSRNASGCTGVHWNIRENKWKASIRVDYVLRHLGSFSSLNDAAAARKSAEVFYGFHENHGRAR